ncbi:hypothetical protein H4R21_000398 [Coemansia helicoidea]|uniref:Uncharacterized protein n=1 Tax=Coemansia helicoidea TaxID=1286919 RepID=A0ACC1LGE3_9FUNG|nr:hypothetical protein H4R21_000398 [Coemansia helicoidea]
MSRSAGLQADGQLDCADIVAVEAPPPPPYSPLDPCDGGLGGGESEPVLPTGLVVAADTERTLATQLLLPDGMLAVVLEGFASVAATVRVADADGLLGVAAAFYRDSSGGPAVAASSTVDEKTGRRTVRFAPDEPHTGGGVRAECSITLPESAALGELALRLPAGSQLDIESVARAMVRRLDVAMISGAARLTQVCAGSMRVAVGDGSIDATGMVAAEAAEFIACSGSVQVRGCSAKAIRANTPGARLGMSELLAEALSISGRQADIAVSASAADSVAVNTCAGAVTLDGVSAGSLDVRTDTAPVRGSWSIGRRATIAVGAAMVQGRMAVASDEVHAAISASGWPVQLSVSDSFRGAFDVSAAGSIANVGFAGATTHERRPHRVQGVVGTGPSSLRITNAQAPVAVTTFPPASAI